MPSVAWLERLRQTLSILIKAKRKQLTKTLDRVSKMFCSISTKVFIEVYIDNRSVFVIVYHEILKIKVTVIEKT